MPTCKRRHLLRWEKFRGLAEGEIWEKSLKVLL